jgi:saccharopine dehydrogenase-like NADP-dependent oxidoreductase
MRILVIGAGGVGSAVAAIARRRGFFERMVLADLSPERARSAVAGMDGDGRFGATALDASDADAIVALAKAERADTILNACDPWLNPPIFAAAARAGCTYLDMAMTLSQRDPERPFEPPGVMLGDGQFAVAGEWEAAGRLALCGIGVEPGMSDVFARYAADHLFDRIDEVGVRDGADLAVAGHAFAPTFSIWTTIEECLNPPLVWERERGWYTTRPFSEPELFEFPAGIGPVECVNVEHEEVVLVPRWVDCERVTFKYGLGDEFIGVLKTLHMLGLDSTELLGVKGVEVAPRDVVAAALPDPATLGDAMTGRTCGARSSPGPPTMAPRARSTYTTSSTTRRRWRATASRPSCGRPRSARSWRSSCSRPARGRGPACSGPRRSTPRRSSTCWPTTTVRMPCRSAIPRIRCGQPGRTVVCRRRRKISLAP